MYRGQSRGRVSRHQSNLEMLRMWQVPINLVSDLTIHTLLDVSSFFNLKFSGECLGGGPRDVAEHFLGLHPSRLAGEDGNVGHHAGRLAECRKDSLADEITLYLERVRERAERPSPPSRRSQETQTIPATLLPPATSFLLHDVHAASSTQNSHLHQVCMASSTGHRRYL